MSQGPKKMRLKRASCICCSCSLSRGGTAARPAGKGRQILRKGPQVADGAHPFGRFSFAGRHRAFAAARRRHGNCQTQQQAGQPLQGKSGFHENLLREIVALSSGIRRLSGGGRPFCQSIFSLKRCAFQIIRPVVPRNDRPGGAVPPPRVFTFFKAKTLQICVTDMLAVLECLYHWCTGGRACVRPSVTRSEQD